MEEVQGNERYRRHCQWARENSNDEALALHYKVWNPTPWVIDVRLPETNSGEWFEMMDWCGAQYGPQSWPIHNRPGNWYIAGATVFGHTHMGFATEEMMQRFMAQFPDRIWPDTSEELVSEPLPSTQRGS